MQRHFLPPSSLAPLLVHHFLPHFLGSTHLQLLKIWSKKSPFLPGSIHIQGTVVEEIKQDLKKRKRVFFLSSWILFFSCSKTCFLSYDFSFINCHLCKLIGWWREWPVLPDLPLWPALSTHHSNRSCHQTKQQGIQNCHFFLLLSLLFIFFILFFFARSHHHFLIIFSVSPVKGAPRST